MFLTKATEETLAFLNLHTISHTAASPLHTSTQVHTQTNFIFKFDLHRPRRRISFWQHKNIMKSMKYKQNMTTEDIKTVVIIYQIKSAIKGANGDFNNLPFSQLVVYQQLFR